MGNCMETSTQREQEEEDQTQQQQQQHEQEDDGREKESNSNSGNIRVKIVLSKEELEWLMVELKDRGGKSLEDVLEEIQKGRAKVDEAAWKPSLESIMECPEVIDEMDR